MAEIIKPGNFGVFIPADALRREFDIKNEQIINQDRDVDIVFVGDSITCFWQLNAYFQDFGFVVNRGISGDSTTYILKRSDADVFQLKPKKVVYLAGINDLLTTAPDLWWKTDGANSEEVISTISNNIEAFMKKCIDNGVIGYFCSVLPTDFCIPYNTYGIEQMILKVNENISSLCKKYNMTYVDYYSKLCKDDNLHIIDGSTHDVVHPNSKAYTIMAKTLKSRLEVLS